jgi:hypothetical protein
VGIETNEEMNMDKPVFNVLTKRWEFQMFGRIDSYATEQQALNSLNQHYDWMFSDTDYDLTEGDEE